MRAEVLYESRVEGQRTGRTLTEEGTVMNHSSLARRRTSANLSAPWTDPEQVKQALAATQAFYDQEAAFNEIALLLHASVELGEILGVLARHTQKVIPFTVFDVVLREDNAVDYTLYNLRDLDHADDGPGVRARPASRTEGGVYLRALDTGMAATANLLDPRWEAALRSDPRLVQWQVRAAMSVPLKAGGQVIGALCFYSRDAGGFDDEELRLGQLLALPIATAVRNAMLYARERRRSQKLQALQRVGAAATTTLDRDALLGEACRQISAEFGYYKVNLATMDEDSVYIAPCHRLFHGRSLRADQPVDVIPRSVASIMTTAANEQRIVHAPNVAEHPLYYPEPGSRTRSEVAIPIVWRGQTFGLLDVQSEQLNAFSEEDIQLLGVLANQLAAGLENCRLYDQVSHLLDTYVPATVTRHLRAQPERPVAGGKRRRISVLFADLRGFTRYAEGRDPEVLLQTLNTYLGVATEAITEFGGTLDKFMGDGVMALFNAPDDQEDHALLAVRAALLIQQRMGELDPQGIDQLHFGIGVNTGEVVVGNIGTSSVLNYTAIGDTVNVAKRLQERASGRQVLVSDHTFELVQGRVGGEPLGPLPLHNRREAVHAYLLHPVRL